MSKCPKCGGKGRRTNLLSAIIADATGFICGAAIMCVPSGDIGPKISRQISKRITDVKRYRCRTCHHLWEEHRISEL